MTYTPKTVWVTDLKVYLIGK